MRSFARELKIWTKLSHRNVLPCLGFAEYNNLPVLVSEWMENRNIIEFLTKNNNADRLEMVCIFALFVMEAALISPTKAWGIACGLGYLHENGIVHSDLKGVSTIYCS